MTTAELIDSKQSDIQKTSFSSKLNAALDLSSSAINPDENTVNRFYYSVGSYNFMLEDGLKAETLKNANINSVPDLPSWHKGIISIRGIIMPVIEIHAFIQIQMKKDEKKHSDKNYLLKLEHKEHAPIVFIIDKLPKLINIKNIKKSKKPKSLPGWINSYIKHDSVKIAQISHKELLNQIIKLQ